MHFSVLLIMVSYCDNVHIYVFIDFFFLGGEEACFPWVLDRPSGNGSKFMHVTYFPDVRYLSFTRQVCKCYRSLPTAICKTTTTTTKQNKKNPPFWFSLFCNVSVSVSIFLFLTQTVCLFDFSFLAVFASSLLSYFFLLSLYFFLLLTHSLTLPLPIPVFFLEA